VFCHSLQPRYSFLAHFAQAQAVKVISSWVEASQQVRKLSPLLADYLFQNVDIDVEPMYLLKMTCPSTGFIHSLRVPPDIKSARAAIRWVNWGIEPEEFALQS
jgi:hypothetical protein